MPLIPTITCFYTSNRLLFGKHHTSISDPFVSPFVSFDSLIRILLYENRAYKKLSSIEAWENSKKASVEAELKRLEVTYLLFVTLI